MEDTKLLIRLEIILIVKWHLLTYFVVHIKFLQEKHFACKLNKIIARVADSIPPKYLHLRVYAEYQLMISPVSRIFVFICYASLFR